MGTNYAFVANIRDPKILAWIRGNLWILNYCNNEQDVMDKYRIINSIKNLSLLEWIKLNPWILNYCGSEQDVINKYIIMRDIDDLSIIEWIRENPNVLNYYSSSEQIINEYNNINGTSDVNNSQSQNRGFGKKLINGHFHASEAPVPHNEYDFDRNQKAAFVNWYGIIITLILSFAIGYFIAWFILKIH